MIKISGKRIKTNRTTLDFMRVFRLVFIILQGHITATLMFQYGINHEAPSDTILERVSKYLGHASTNTTFDVYMDYVSKLSRIRDISESVADPFYYPVSGGDEGGV